MASFQKNDSVFIPSLKKFGVVLGERKPGLWEVAIGNLTLQCQEQDLQAVQHKKNRHPTSAYSEPRRKPVPRPTQRAAERLDLHGLRVEEAMRRVESAIDRAILAEVDRMEIVHGLGTGKIRKALHAYLNSLNVVASFKIDDGNPGVTLVYF